MKNKNWNRIAVTMARMLLLVAVAATCTVLNGAGSNSICWYGHGY